MPEGAEGKTAERKVQGPAIGVIATGVLGIVLALMNLLMLPFGWAGELATYQESWEERIGSSVVWVITGLSALLDIGACGFLIWAGIQMKSLRQWGASLVACIVALVPCLGCCLIGIPIGIWGLIVLNDAQVKEAFKS